MGLVNLYRIQALYAHVRTAIDHRARLADRGWWTELFARAWRVQEVREMFAALAGYKTYIVAALGAVVTLLHTLGRIDDATYQTLMALLASGGVATVRAALSRIERLR